MWPRKLGRWFELEPKAGMRQQGMPLWPSSNALDFVTHLPTSQLPWGFNDEVIFPVDLPLLTPSHSGAALW